MMSSVKCVVCRNIFEAIDFKSGKPLLYSESMNHLVEDEDEICYACARTHILTGLTKEYSTWLEPFFKRVNRGKVDAEALADAICSEHRYLQQEFLFTLFRALMIIGQRADSNVWTDARNEISFKFAGRAMETISKYFV